MINRIGAWINNFDTSSKTRLLQDSQGKCIQKLNLEENDNYHRAGINPLQRDSDGQNTNEIIFTSTSEHSYKLLSKRHFVFLY